MTTESHSMSMVSTKYEGELAVEELVEKFFHRPYRVGIWRERQELHQDHAARWQRARSSQRCG